MGRIELVRLGGLPGGSEAVEDLERALSSQEDFVGDHGFLGLEMVSVLVE